MEYRSLVKTRILTLMKNTKLFYLPIFIFMQSCHINNKDKLSQNQHNNLQNYNDTLSNEIYVFLIPKSLVMEELKNQIFKSATNLPEPGTHFDYTIHTDSLGSIIQIDIDWNGKDSLTAENIKLYLSSLGPLKCDLCKKLNVKPSYYIITVVIKDENELELYSKFQVD